MKDAGQRGPGADLAVGIGVLLLAGALAWGAVEIPSAAGYAGVGPNFLPWAVVAGLAVCGVSLLREALVAHRTGRRPAAMPGAPTGPVCWTGLAWVAAGLVLNAWLITRVGFVLACAVLFVGAARGFRTAQGTPGGVGTWAVDAAVGLLLAAAVYWIFTKALGLALPGLTTTGWI